MLKRLANFFSQKLRAGAAIFGFDSARMKANYRTYAKEAYRDNPYAHAAIKMTAQAVADIPAKLYRVNESEPIERALKEAPRMYEEKKPQEMREAANRLLTEKIKEYRKRGSTPAAKHVAKKELIRENVIEPVDNHEIYGLLQEPNQYTQTSFQEFMVSLTSYLEIGGSVLVQPTRGSGTDANINTLEVRMPHDLEIRRNATQPIAEIKIENEHGEEETFNYEADPTDSDVFFERYFHPTEPRYGLSPVEAAAMSVDVNNEARRWNLGLLQNGAQPSGVLSFENNLGDSKRQAVKKQWRQRHAGPSNAGSIMIADGGGGADFKQVGMSPNEMQWSNLTRLSAREVSIVWNVPAQLLGHTESQTYNNYRSARRSFYVEKIIPLVTKLYGFLNSTIIPHYDEPLLLDYETASVDALKKEINEMHERAREDVQNTLLTINEARDRIGMGEVEGGDVLLMNTTHKPLRAALEDGFDEDEATLEPLDIGGDSKDEPFYFDPKEAARLNGHK